MRKITFDVQDVWPSLKYFYVLKVGTERKRKSTYIYEKKKKFKTWLAHFSKIAEGEKEREE